jgi:hypothetical protein
MRCAHSKSIMRQPNSPRHLLLSAAAATALVATACAPDAFEDAPDEIYGMDGPVYPVPEDGKDDGLHRVGLPVSVDNSDTRVWDVRNQWEDTDTPAARAAGLAWGENSGLTWDEKYQLWVQSLERVEGIEGRYDTFMLTTPWGVERPSPALECAELSMFLRITFAAWYELPLFFESIDSNRNRLYFGHFGIRTANGRYQNTPRFATQYRDYTDLSPAEYQASWPSDPTLRNRRLFGGTDEQPMIGEGEVFGAYLDEIHLNKRAGYFTALTINYLGSVNLADSANTYNIVPEAVRAGDTLMHRWQRVGIGHTLVVKDVVQIGEGNLDATVVSGSMPRRQGVWESGVASKRYFTNPHGGGVGENNDGHRYVTLGGGIKRFRVAKNVNGRWTNTFMSADEANWIQARDYDRLAARPGRFEQILGEVPPEQMRDALVALIDDARHHLSRFPASCAARTRRETAFEELYDLSAREFGMSRAEVDERYRLLEDYVFAELEYNQSRTCCWNSTTTNMYEIILERAEREMDEATALGQCIAPTVFRAKADGFESWRRFASELGRAHQWVDWSADEHCPWQNVAEDTTKATAPDFCEL